ncbi:MAG: response regulator [Planctomycetota bacterium]
MESRLTGTFRTRSEVPRGPFRVAATIDSEKLQAPSGFTEDNGEDAEGGVVGSDSVALPYNMPTILLAGSILDDSEDLTAVLQSAGYVVETAYSGPQAIDVAESVSADVMILDSGMEGVSALEVCRRMRDERRRAHTPIVVLCAEDSEFTETDFLDVGARCCLPREGPVETLLASVRAALRERTRVQTLREMNYRLDEARVCSERLARLRSEYLASMSHEIRTPLTAILGYADLLLDPGASNEDRLAWVQTIRKSGVHLMTILNDILDFSKIEAGRMTVERIRFSPLQLLEEVRSLMRPRAEEKELEFDVEVQGEVPAEIESDPTRVRQVLVNLVSNGVKFTDSGDVKVFCRAIPNEDTPCEFLEFEVRDSGIGMSEAERDQVFRAYGQVTNDVTRKYGGTGLGLSISKRLVELLGGTISVTSEKDRGSTFSFAIPVGDLVDIQMVTEAGEEPDESNGSNESEALQGRVLLAEDVPTNQQLLRFHLERAGLEVVVADNGLVAVEVCREYQNAGDPFDIVLMDMQMPKMDGYTATSCIRSEGFQGPVVALTAHALEGEREKCIRAGCDDFASKPIDRKTLLETVRRNLGRQPIRNYGDPQLLASVVSEEVAQDLEALDDGGPVYSELLRTVGSQDPELVRMVRDFARDLPAWVGGFHKKLAARDFDRIADECHQLKGAAGGFGFPQIGDIADQMESIATTTRNVRKLGHALERLQDLVSRIETEEPVTDSSN